MAEIAKDSGSNGMDIAIVGAGITGLSAAYDLTRQGHDVTVYEARPYAGGLAAGFRDRGWDWHLERFYHDLGYETVPGTESVAGHRLITMTKAVSPHREQT